MKKLILIVLLLLIWYGFNYTACMAEHNTWPHTSGGRFDLNDPQHMAKERGSCLIFSVALPVVPLVTGGYWALRHNGFAW